MCSAWPSSLVFVWPLGSGATCSSANEQPGRQSSGCYRDGRGSGLTTASLSLLRGACACPNAMPLDAPSFVHCAHAVLPERPWVQRGSRRMHSHTRTHTSTRTRTRTHKAQGLLACTAPWLVCRVLSGLRCTWDAAPAPSRPRPQARASNWSLRHFGTSGRRWPLCDADSTGFVIL
jgi:hypothetical protein